MVQPPLKQQKISHPAAQETQEEKAAGGASPGAASSAPPEAGRDAPFDPRVHAGMLGIPVIEPTRPTKPPYHEIIGGGAVPCTLISSRSRKTSYGGCRRTSTTIQALLYASLYTRSELQSLSLQRMDSVWRRRHTRNHGIWRIA